MKTMRKMVAIFFAGLIVVACAGCSALVQLFENEELRKNTDILLNAILADDFDSAYSVVDEIHTEEDFAAVFNEVKNLLADVEYYDLSILSAYQKQNVGEEGVVRSSTAAYQMTTNSHTYVIDVEMVSPQKDLSSFYITPYEKTDYYSVGTISNMSNASVLQWIMLLSNVVIIGFVVFAIVDCCRQKIKLKALWLVIIILGFVTVGATMAAASFRFNFNIGWLFAYNTYITYGGGTKMIRFLLPIGTVVYFILRNSMIRKARFGENNVPISECAQPDGQNTDFDGTPHA